MKAKTLNEAVSKTIRRSKKKIETLGGAPELSAPTEGKQRGGLLNRMRRFVCN
jgi:hypothetical protein